MLNAAYIKKFTIVCPPLRSGHKACIVHTDYYAGHTKVTQSPNAKLRDFYCVLLSIYLSRRVM